MMRQLLQFLLGCGCSGLENSAPPRRLSGNPGRSRRRRKAAGRLLAGVAKVEITNKNYALPATRST